MKEIVFDFSRHAAKNAQHVEFMRSVLEVVTEEVAMAQGFAAQRDAFAAAVDDEVARFQPEKAFLDTPEITAADALRDNTFLFQKSLSKAYADYCPDAELRKSGQTAFFLFNERDDAYRQD